MRDLKRKQCLGVLAILSLLLFSSPSQASDLQRAIANYVAVHQRQIISELVELLSLPNVASNRENIRKNAEFLSAMLQRRGLTAEILETEGNPLVYGERRIPGASRTLLFYMHYDGQPVNRAQWKQEGPFTPILRAGRLEDGARQIPNLEGLVHFEPDWRLYARSASDDKSPIVAFCNALDALKSVGRRPSSNIRIILDGEEEAGSGSLTAAITQYRDKLRADVMLILDGPLHPSGRPTLNFGARGIATLTLTVYGPRFPLHSGHYGNWVPNPAMRLAQLLASMKDDRGRVVVDGFYDLVPPFDPEERKILAAVPDDWNKLRRLFGVAEPDAVGQTLQEAIQLPSLNVRGLSSAYVGAGARTIIPSEATASIDIRLVKETPGRELVKRVLDHIRKQGYHIVQEEPDGATRLEYSKIIRVTGDLGGGTQAYRTEMDSPASRAVTRALERIWDEEPVRIRTSGGTVPISQFIRSLGFPAISVPTVNFDNNQHSPNENLRVGHFWNAIVSIAALLVM